MATVAVRVDDSLKEEASALFKDLGIDMSTAVKMFLVQSVKSKGLPFEVKQVGSDLDYVSEAIKRIPSVRVSVSNSKSLEEFFGDEDFSEYEEVFK